MLLQLDADAAAAAGIRQRHSYLRTPPSRYAAAFMMLLYAR